MNRHECLGFPLPVDEPIGILVNMAQAKAPKESIMRYRVRFSTKTEGVAAIEWEPNEGDGYECTKREAMRRWEHLLIEGRHGRAVDGVVPYIVEIVDSNNVVMLAQATYADDVPSGKWGIAAAA